MHTKPLPILLIILIFLGACQHEKPAASPTPTIKPQFDPDRAHRFNSLEPREILNRLYDSPVIHGRTAIWKPNYSETMSYFRVSYDDSCHTTIDTILYFKDHDSTNCAVIVFATYYYFVDSLDGMKIKIGGCHSCGAVVGMALFSQNTDRSWENYAYTKSLTVSGVLGGAIEGIGQFSFVQLGDRWTGLLLKEPVYANMGEEKAYSELYSIEKTGMNGYNSDAQLQVILSYISHNSYHDVPRIAEKEENTALEVVKRERQYLIRLVTTSNEKRKITYYRYSDEDQKYVPVRER